MQRKIVHIDIDPSSISKRVKVDIPIVGDVKDVLRELIDQLKEGQHKPDAAALSAWWSQINEWRKRECLTYKRSTEVIKPQQVVETLWQLTRNSDVYITSDVGQHQMWAAQFYGFNEPRRWINSGGLGTMGVGLPYAMGIKLAKPQADVFCITGEGSIQMCIQELSTCLQYKTPVKIVSLNNRYLGMVRQWQEIDYGGRYSHSYMDALPDFVKLAEAYGHVGLLVEKPADVEPALARGHQAEGPHGLPRFPHRSHRERLADGAGRQRHHRDAARFRGPLSARGRRFARVTALREPVGSSRQRVAASVLTSKSVAKVRRLPLPALKSAKDE